MPNPITRRIRHVQRYAQVLEVLAKQGFADLSQQLRLDTLIERGRAILTNTAADIPDATPLAERVRMVLEDLGPTFVKLGQIMSTRPDLIPPEWANEFKKLQNKVPGVPFETVSELLAEEFPEGVDKRFSWIEETAIAAGSMAQVHRAKLVEGPEIVLKILRPGIDRQIETDMDILLSLAELVESHFENEGYSPTQVVRTFAKELKREVDMVHEGRSTERLGTLFRDDPDIVFPGVYWDHTTSRVLAIDLIQGTPLANATPEQLPPHIRRKVVENGARAVFKQCLEQGFFHADPHPGNIMLLQHGQIAFIDCGMTGQIDPQTADLLADLVGGVVKGDLDRVMNAAAAITDTEDRILDDRAIRADVMGIVAQFKDTSLARIQIGQVLRDFFAILRANRVQCPADIMLLIKALVTIESVARELDPTFELTEFVRPYLEKLVQKRYGVAAMDGRMKKGMLQYLELIEDLPKEIRPILKQIRRKEMTLNIDHTGLDRLTGTIEHASRNISFALVVAAMLVGSSILVLAARESSGSLPTAIGIGGFVIALVLVVLIILSNNRRK